MSERRAIIARRLVQAASAVIPLGSLILLPHEAAEWKKILRNYAFDKPTAVIQSRR
jgi:hypothetical protein